MQIATCEFPVQVKDSFGHIQYVPCGHCQACLNTRSLHWQNRIEDETKCWKYCVFFTLKYAPEHLHILHIAPNSCSNDFKLLDTDTAELYEFPAGSVSLNAASFCRRMIKVRKPVAALSKRDIQLFMKLLRYYVTDLLKGSTESKTVRYYITGEYGPTTFRPHYHGVLWFNSDTVASYIRDIICKAWPHNNYSVQPLEFSFVEHGSGTKRTPASYIASYVNSVSNLSEVHRHKSLRPFALYSKCPPIGSLFYTEEKVRQIFDTASPTISQNVNGENVDVPILPYLKNRLFPRLPLFTRLSITDRNLLYGAVRFSAAQTYDEFEDWCRDQVGRYRTRFTQLLQYFTENDPFLCKPLSSLKNLYYTSKRVLLQCEVFHIRLSDYVERIDRFYYNQAQAKLRSFYNFQQHLIEKYRSVASSLSLYYNSIQKFYELLSYSFTDFYAVQAKERLLTFGVNPEQFVSDASYRNSLRLENNPDYLSWLHLHHKVFSDQRAKKFKKEYLALHPELQILHFQNG